MPTEVRGDVLTEPGCFDGACGGTGWSYLIDRTADE